MRPLLWLAALLVPCQVNAAAVFAHFMVGNVEQYTSNDWLQDIALAYSVGIDAFALNIANGWEYNEAQVALAFNVAEAQLSLYGFKLFFSFDYAGGGAWNEEDVISMISAHSSSSAYYQYNGKPFVSTFEGPANAEDWINIKSKTGCFFVPNWSSSGATVAVDLAGGVADGLFSWAAWPYGNRDMDTYIDASYSLALGDKPYMMPVSPWFYTNLPGYDKNWMWNGDNLWYDRWQQAINYAKGGSAAPEWIEILTWNDFGESHYIGPLDDRQYEAFSIGEAPYNYVEGLSHDGWRTQLKWMADLYKNGEADSGQESLVITYRTSYAQACGDGGTTGNTASQLQEEIYPYQITKDQIGISALLSAPVDSIHILYGSGSYDIEWKYTPEGGAGLYYGVFTLPGSDSGQFGIYLGRGTETAISLSTTIAISSTCTDDITNWNPNVAYALGDIVDIAQSVADHVCIKGWGLADFSELCEFTCGLGYCPTSACVCSQYGAKPDQPTDGGTPVNGYPADGDANWSGLCSFACGLGEDYCFPAFCSQTEQPEVIPTVSPFTPAACVKGTGIASFADLCAWSCAYGYCPLNGCACTLYGDLVLAPDPDASITASFTPIADNWRYDDLCTWTCSRGYCPDVCASTSDVITGCVSGSGEGNLAGLCGFACGRGYCPDPCVCATTGSIANPELTADPAITGYGAAGMDHTIYDQLCNFTCSHGYCPEPDACVESFTGNLTGFSDDITLPTLSSYIVTPLEDVTYKAGDFFRYQSEDDANISVDVSLLGEPGELPQATCDFVTPGDDGNALGCIGESTEFLMLSLMEDDAALQNRAESDYTFVTHEDWEAQPNCSMHCRLQNEAPLNTWMPVGNGTYNNRHHELHFMNTGKSITYKSSAAANSLSNTTDLEKRIVWVPIIIGVAAVFGGSGSIYGISQIGSKQHINNRPILAGAVGAAVIKTATNRFLESCLYPNDNDTSILATNSANDGIAFIISSSGKTGEVVNISADEADSYTETCATEGSALHEYWIYPQDGLNVATIQALLDSYPAANVVEEVSLNGHGVLFWEASLTMPQVLELTLLKETMEVEASCSPDCPNPKELSYDESYGTKPSRVMNKSRASSKVKQRDSGFVVEAGYDQDVSFISNPEGSDRTKDYVYDNSAGEGVTLYILDPEAFDTDLEEFSVDPDSNGLTLEAKAGAPVLSGKSSFTVADCDDPGFCHGTAMLAAAAGGRHGVAHKITPRLHNFAYSLGHVWILKSLDKIEADWPARKAAMSSDLAPLGVLSMSFGVEPAAATVFSTSAFPKKFREALQRLIALGILTVSSAGNENVESYKYPAKFSDPRDTNYILNHVIVGCVDTDAVKWDESNYADFISVHAPGVDSEIPFFNATTNAEEVYWTSGTSNSAARTAGLAAYYIGMSSNKATLTSVQQLKYFIVDSAYDRGTGLKCIFNNAPET